VTASAIDGPFAMPDNSRSVRSVCVSSMVKSRLRGVVCATVLSAVIAAPAAWATRPTPHELLDREVAPLAHELETLHATETERENLRDVLSVAETLAAERVEARQRGETEHVEALGRRMVLLARLARGRIDAARLEASAADVERAADAREAERVHTRAVFDRVVAEHRAALLGSAPGASPAPSEQP